MTSFIKNLVATGGQNIVWEPLIPWPSLRTAPDAVLLYMQLKQPKTLFTMLKWHNEQYSLQQ